MTPRNPHTKETAMTYTADSPRQLVAVLLDIAEQAEFLSDRLCDVAEHLIPAEPVDPDAAAVAVLNEHKRGLQDRLAATQAVNEINGKVIADLIAQRDDLAEQVSELTDLLEAARTGVGAPAHAAVVLPADVRVGDRLRVVTEYQMTVTGMGNSRTGDVCVFHDDIQALTLDTSWPLDDGRTSLYLVDRPEPADPDAAAVEAMADEAWRVIGEFPGLDITFDPGTDDDRDLCEQIARAALAAYRTHIDKEA